MRRGVKEVVKAVIFIESATSTNSASEFFCFRFARARKESVWLLATSHRLTSSAIYLCYVRTMMCHTYLSLQRKLWELLDKLRGQRAVYWSRRELTVSSRRSSKRCTPRSRRCNSISAIFPTFSICVINRQSTLSVLRKDKYLPTVWQCLCVIVRLTLFVDFSYYMLYAFCVKLSNILVKCVSKMFRRAPLLWHADVNTHFSLSELRTRTAYGNWGLIQVNLMAWAV